MMTDRPTNQQLSSRYSWIILTTLAALFCFPAIGSAEQVDDKKAAVKKAVEKKSSDKVVKPVKVDKSKGHQVKKPVKVDKSKSDKAIKSTKGDKKVVVDKKAALVKKADPKKGADVKKKAPVKQAVDKKSIDKVVKPVKVDKSKGDQVKKPVKVDKSKGDKVIKSTKGDKKVVVDKKAAVVKKADPKKGADAKKKAAVKQAVDKKSIDKVVKPVKVDKSKGDQVKKPVKVDKSKGDKVIKSTKGDKKVVVDKKPPAKKGVNVKSGDKSVAPKKIDKSKIPQKKYAAVNVPKSIELTPEQSEKVAALDKEYAPQLKELTEKRNAVMTPEQRNAGREALNAAKNAGKTAREIKEAYAAAVQYTDEQKQQFQDIQTELKELHKTIQGKFNELLTDEQKSQIKNANAKGSQKSQKKKILPSKTKK